MSSRVAKQLRNPLTFSFTTIFERRSVFVTIYIKKGYYGVLIDDDRFIQVKYKNELRNWSVSKGELNDPIFVKEIGERIASRFN